MKLLITTQKVDKNDSILGFFHDWIIEFAKHFEFVTVICLYEGEHDLPENVKVLSLGKEERQSRMQYLIHFFWYIWHERKNYDVVFVHMNQIYVVLGGMLWRIWGKKVNLWYTHRAKGMNLRIAAFFTQNIFTASEESLTLVTKKKVIVGHGIDIKAFAKKSSYPHAKPTIVSIGRITRIKNLDTLINAAAVLKEKGLDFAYTLVGPTVTSDDEVYMQELKTLIAEKGVEQNITFAGGVTQDKVPEYFWKSDINVNLTPTGGVDKVVLQGIAAGVLPLVSNQTFAPIFGPYAKQLIFEVRNPEDLAYRMQKLWESKIRDAMLANLQTKIEVDFDLPNIIARISSDMLL